MHWELLQDVQESYCTNSDWAARHWMCTRVIQDIQMSYCTNSDWAVRNWMRLEIYKSLHTVLWHALSVSQFDFAAWLH